MPIPPWSKMSLPLLALTADGQEHPIADTVDAVADRLNIPQEEREIFLPSGHQTRLANRVYWASTYLKKAGLLEAPRRGRIQITAEGRKVLQNPPPQIDRKWLLANYQCMQEFVTPTSDGRGSSDMGDNSNRDDVTPEETLEQAYQQMREELADELLTQAKALTPTAFEQLVVELLVNMGYGGTRRDAGQAIGKSGDGGIDGIIKEDRLGLDTIYIQAKRYTDQPISRPDIQAFVGALQGVQARKGIFITTSTFSSPALDYIKNIEAKVVLIDGRQIAEYMIDFNVGVTMVNTFEVKRLDGDYFNT